MTSVTLEFKDVRFSATEWSLQRPIRRRREILRGLNGEFRAGQLTAIVGPSGAGKTSLLNVLALYRSRGAQGTVLANGEPAGAWLRRRAVYIQQEDRLRPALTASEAVQLSARLRGCDDVQHQTEELLRLLGLWEQQNTQTSRLSGGQRKRLSIALELVADPPVLFLDEPTTGLDSSSCWQCMTLLRRLSRQGRTVVCTIHQPSARLFALLDHVYAVAAGRCVYQGAPSRLVPFLAARGLHCPPHHNPADFLMDVSLGEYGADVEQLATAADKRRDSSSEVEAEVPVVNGNARTVEVKEICKEKRNYKKASMFLQYYLLCKRNLICLRREYTHFLNRLLAHMSIGLVFGYLYFNCGASADAAYANFVYIYGTVLFLLYTAKMAVTLHFPLELKTVQSEYFNRWYSLFSYYLTILSMEIPIQIVCNFIYLLTSYYLTNQPIELYRMGMFFALANIASLAAQGSGFIIGALTPVKIAVFIGPTLLALISMFGFNIFHKDIPSSLEFMFHISYFRAAFQGIMSTMYAEGRGELPCPADTLYCHYRYPKKFLMDVDMMNVNIIGNLVMVSGVALMMYIVAFLAIWFRLSRRWPGN